MWYEAIIELSSACTEVAMSSLRRSLSTAEVIFCQSEKSKRRFDIWVVRWLSIGWQSQLSSPFCHHVLLDTKRPWSRLQGDVNHQKSMANIIAITVEPQEFCKLVFLSFQGCVSSPPREVFWWGRTGGNCTASRLRGAAVSSLAPCIFDLLSSVLKIWKA